MAEARTVTEQLLADAAKELGVELERLREVGRRVRSELERKVSEVWESPEGRLLADLLSYMADVSGYSDEVKRFWTEDRKAELRRIAREANVGGFYRLAYGKHRRRRG